MPFDGLISRVDCSDAFVKTFAGISMFWFICCIGAEEFTTMKEDYQAVLDYAGFKKKIHGFLAAPLIWALRLLEALHLSPLYKWVYETAAKDSFVSIDKAKKMLGFNPHCSNKDALIRNHQWYLGYRDSFANTSGVSHRVPLKQGILGFLKVFF